MLSFTKFQEKRKKTKDPVAYISTFGEDSTDLRSIYPYHYEYANNYLIPVKWSKGKKSFYLPYGGKDRRSSDLEEMEAILYGLYCSDYLNGTEDLKIISEAVLSLKYGSNAQVELETKFFELAGRLGFNRDDNWYSSSMNGSLPEKLNVVLEWAHRRNAS